MQLQAQLEAALQLLQLAALEDSGLLALPAVIKRLDVHPALARAGGEDSCCTAPSAVG